MTHRRTHGVHERLVHRRRVRILARHLGSILPPAGTVLDIGCGDGLLDALLVGSLPAVSVRGVDVLVRPNAHIAVDAFDGRVLPHPDKSFDATLLVDVLHHTPDPMILLAEATRVSRSAVIVKDHTNDAWLADSRLRFMDWVANRKHGMALPYNYWTSAQWFEAFNRLGWQPRVWMTGLHLYPPGVDRVFGRSLHVLTRLEPRPGGADVV